MDRQEFWKLMADGFDLCGWLYDENGELFDYSENVEALAYQFNNIFIITKCKQAMMEHFAESDTPLVLTAPLGISWVAALQEENAGMRYYHLLGPALCGEIPKDTIREALSPMSLSLPKQSSPQEHRIENLVCMLPLLPHLILPRVALQLHSFATGERTAMERVIYITLPTQSPLPGLSSVKMSKWTDSHQLMEAVRAGDIKSALLAGLSVTSGVGDLQMAKFAAMTIQAYANHAASESGLPGDILRDLASFNTRVIAESRTVQGVNQAIQSMLEDLTKRLRLFRQDASLSKEIHSCCEYIRYHLNDDLTTKQLANRLGYATYYLTKKFKRETGQSVNEYIRNQKIERAKFLLHNTSMSIRRISESLCFSSSSYFSTVFQQETGKWPTDYRAEKYRRK